MIEYSKSDYVLVEGGDMEVTVVRTGDAKPADRKEPAPTKPHGRRWKTIAILTGVLAAILVLVIAWIGYRRYTNIGVPISRQPAENIALMERQMAATTKVKPGVTLTSDSILGVAMDFYRLDGLHGTLSTTEPRASDKSVFLYVRASDYLADGTLIGSTVIDGQQQPSSNRRNGYVAMAGNATVIGISPSNKVMDFVKEKGGSFFRQFILVSNGVLPRQFYLHGKVERRALGRIGDTLYIVCTREKETMWDFADALREYGFADAIYITGGDDRTFYRTADGKPHMIGTDNSHRAGIPWLVFKRNK